MGGVTNDSGPRPGPLRLTVPARHFVLRTARPAGREPAHGYRVDVTAEGPVNGATVAVSLGSRMAPSRWLALRWLREQALRIADGLDPDPAAHWAAGRVLDPVPARLADAPTELRRWCEDEERQRAAADRLAEGLPFLLTAADHTGRYALCARPHRLPPWSSEPHSVPVQRRAGSFTHPR